MTIFGLESRLCKTKSRLLNRCVDFVFVQEALASLKDELEQKEAEIKRLQEKLAYHVKGEGPDINDRGKAECQSLFMADN